MPAGRGRRGRVGHPRTAPTPPRCAEAGYQAVLVGESPGDLGRPGRRRWPPCARAEPRTLRSRSATGRGHAGDRPADHRRARRYGVGVFVKICGITNEEDALLAVAMGADAVGFVFAPSPRQIAVTQARDIARRLPPEILTVGVFRDEASRRVVEMVNAAGLHGGAAARPRDPGRGPSGSASGCSSSSRPSPPATACSTGSTTTRRRRGDDRLAHARVRAGVRLVAGRGRCPLDRRVILAGGLTPDNVAEAVAPGPSLGRRRVHRRRARAGPQGRVEAHALRQRGQGGGGRRRRGARRPRRAVRADAGDRRRRRSTASRRSTTGKTTAPPVDRPLHRSRRIADQDASPVSSSQSTPAGPPSAMGEPTSDGRFGEFGGRFVPETLMPACLELEAGLPRRRGPTRPSAPSSTTCCATTPAGRRR